MGVIISPSEDGAERGLSWKPDRPWNLLDLIEKYAFVFVQALQALAHAKTACIIGGADETLTHENREKISLATLRGLHLCRVACSMAGLTQVTPELNRLDAIRVGVHRNDAFSVKTLSGGITHLILRLGDELSSEFFVHVQRSDLEFYGKKELFGPLVSKHFPNSASDIEAAGNCLALEQPTACVFHLMRVMEKGTQALGKKLKVQINPEIETWNKILDHVDKQIRSLPTATTKQKAKKASFAGVSSYLHQAKIAWRNEVMHPKATYTQGEARDVFAASRTFMIHLSEVL